MPGHIAIPGVCVADTSHRADLAPEIWREAGVTPEMTRHDEIDALLRRRH